MAEFNNNNNASKGTSTHIRTLYSENLSYLTITFYNTNLSFKFVPFMTKDANGKNKYNEPKSITTTINYEGAALLQYAAMDIIKNINHTDTMRVPVECNNGVRVVLERKLDQNNQMTTWLSIEKNGETVLFKFDTKIIQITKNGQNISQIIESGLLVFIKIIEGYLTGINADRHLNKLTEDFAKAQENKQPQGDGNQQQQQGGYQNKYQNNGYQKKPYNNYKKPYQNNGYQNNYQNNNQNNNAPAPWANNTPSQSIGMGSYSIQE
jgi:hypothetical protein